MRIIFACLVGLVIGLALLAQWAQVEAQAWRLGAGVIPAGLVVAVRDADAARWHANVFKTLPEERWQFQMLPSFMSYPTIRAVVIPWWMVLAMPAAAWCLAAWIDRRRRGGRAGAFPVESGESK
jgi:hypothetical protein